MDTFRTPLNTIMDGWMAEARVIHSLEARSEGRVDSFPSHVTVCTSCCWSPENLKKQPRNMMLRDLVESKLSVVNCETHLPRCSVTVYAALPKCVSVCVYECYRPHSALILSVFTDCVGVSVFLFVHLDNNPTGRNPSEKEER